MDTAQKQELFERADGVQERVFRTLKEMLPMRGWQLFGLFQVLMLESMLLGGQAVPGPAFQVDECWRDLQENVEVVESLLQEVALAG